MNEIRKERSAKGKLVLFCGKMGPGRTRLSKAIASETRAVLVSEDEWLAAHYPGLIKSFDDYLEYSTLIRPFLKHHVQRILAAGVTVVLDYPANTARQKKWLVGLSNEIGCEHELIYLNVSDEACLEHLALRREEQPERALFDTEEVFHEVTGYFEAPGENEGINIIEQTPA